MAKKKKAKPSTPLELKSRAGAPKAARKIQQGAYRRQTISRKY